MEQPIEVTSLLIAKIKIQQIFVRDRLKERNFKSYQLLYKMRDQLKEIRKINKQNGKTNSK